MSAAAARASRIVPCAIPTRAKPAITSTAESTSQPSAVVEAARDPGEAASRENGDAAVPVHQASRRERRQRAGGEEDGRPETEDPLDVGDEHERDRPDRDGELNHAGERRQRRGEQDRVAANREALHRATLSEQRFGEPRAERRGAAVRGCRTYGPPSRACASRRSRPPGGPPRARGGTCPTARPRLGSAAGSTPPCPDASARGSRAGRRPRARARRASAARSSPSPPPARCRTAGART